MRRCVFGRTCGHKRVRSRGSKKAPHRCVVWSHAGAEHDFPPPCAGSERPRARRGSPRCCARRKRTTWMCSGRCSTEGPTWKPRARRSCTRRCTTRRSETRSRHCAGCSRRRRLGTSWMQRETPRSILQLPRGTSSRWSCSSIAVRTRTLQTKWVQRRCTWRSRGRRRPCQRSCWPRG
jgi:hypothetical protein